MPKALRLTRRASRRLSEIAHWTTDAFGAAQANKYEAALIAQCERLCQGTAHHVSCQSVIDASLPPALRLARCGRHFIIFRETALEVVIVDFLHQRQDGRLSLEGL